MRVSRLAQDIAESPTLKLNDRARVLRDQGEPVIHLGIGEPQNTAPPAAIEAASACLADGKIKYTPTSGLASLKRAIKEYTLRSYGQDVELDQILVSNGAKQTLFNVFLTLIDPGDEVILLAPYWVSYPEMIKMARGIPVIVQPDLEGFHISVNAVQRAVTERTKAILINSPNNPSGVIYDAAFLQAMVDFSEAEGIHLIMDDIYNKLVFDGHHAPGAYQYTGRAIEDTRLIVVNGVSKAYGMTGFRIGWVIAPSTLIANMTKFQAQTTSNPSMVSQFAAEGALGGNQDVVDDLRLEMQHNRDVILKELQAIKGVRVHPPSGTFYCLPDFSRIMKDSRVLADLLLEKVWVVTVPGSAFGMEGHLRLSFAGSEADVREGMRRIRWALDPQTPAHIRIGERELVRDWL